MTAIVLVKLFNLARPKIAQQNQARILICFFFHWGLRKFVMISTNNFFHCKPFLITALPLEKAIFVKGLGVVIFHFHSLCSWEFALTACLPHLKVTRDSFKSSSSYASSLNFTFCGYLSTSHAHAFSFPLQIDAGNYNLFKHQNWISLKWEIWVNCSLFSSFFNFSFCSKEQFSVCTCFSFRGNV